jgi:hypothetical protein
MRINYQFCACGNLSPEIWAERIITWYHILLLALILLFDSSSTYILHIFIGMISKVVDDCQFIYVRLTAVINPIFWILSKLLLLLVIWNWIWIWSQRLLWAHRILRFAYTIICSYVLQFYGVWNWLIILFAFPGFAQGVWVETCIIYFLLHLLCWVFNIFGWRWLCQDFISAWLLKIKNRLNYLVDLVVLILWRLLGHWSHIHICHSVWIWDNLAIIGSNCLFC